MKSGLAREGARRLVFEREEAEAEIMPQPDFAQEAGPSRFARERKPPDMPDDGGIGPHGRVGVEILEPIGAQGQSRCLEAGDDDHDADPGGYAAR